ncbi:MAG: CpaF family protein [Acidimicrobiales bacterium]
MNTHWPSSPGRDSGAGRSEEARPSQPNPLAEIESRVQQRARELSLDMAVSADRGRLDELIGQEVAAWSADYAQGRRPFDLADPEAVTRRARRNLVGLGPLDPLLADDDVWEIMINGPAAVFVKRHRGPSGYHHESFHDDDHLLRILTRVFDDAGGSHRKFDPAEGLQDARLPGGARVHVVHGDIGRDGQLLVNIRKFASTRFSTLEELVAQDMLSHEAARFLSAAMAARLTTVISGPPGSGKTTLLSCCSGQLDPTLRVVMAEEVFEADISLPNLAAMQTRPGRPERPEVDLRRLVTGFLRMAPDIAVVGEVRDREALPLLMTLSSGVKGLTTIHSGSARQALTRLRFLCQLSEQGRDLPMPALNSLVAEGIDLVVHTSRGPDGPRVTEIVAVEDSQAGPDANRFTVTELFGRRQPGGPLVATGVRPIRAAAALEAAGADLRRILAPAETDRPWGEARLADPGSCAPNSRGPRARATDRDQAAAAGCR